MTTEETTRANNGEDMPAAAEGIPATNDEAAAGNGASVANQPSAEQPEHSASEQPDAVAEEQPINLFEELARTQRQANEYLEGWQRARADFANYKKRAERSLLDSTRNATVETITALFPIIDDFERAMSGVPEDLQGHPWLDGVTLIQRKFHKLLDERDIAVIDPVGEPFDPNFHEAVGIDSNSDVESGHVTATLQKGYLHGDRVLRPALVRVAG